MTFWLARLLLCGFLSAAAITAAAEPEIAVTQLSVRNGKIYFPCQFDAFKTNCLLDSGSGFSTVNSSLFDAYPIQGQVHYNSGSGQSLDVPKITVHELHAANLRLQNWPVARLPHLPGFFSIIGLDVFLHSTVYFDFKNLKFQINPKPQPTLHAVPFFYDFGVVLLPVRIGKQNLLAVWDTGASTTVIDQAYIDAHPEDFRYIKDIQGTDAARAALPMKLYEIKSLVIGGAELQGVKVAAMDLAGMHRVYPDFPSFFLGYNVIIQHNWYFDFPHHLWNFD